MIKFNRRTVGVLGAVAAVALALTYWYWPRGEKAAAATTAEATAKPDAELPAVSIAHVKATKLAPQVTYPGTVVSRNDSRLAADYEGAQTEVGALTAFLKPKQ